MIKVIFKRNVTRIATAFALVAMTALSSCEHKDLCFDHDSHSPKYKFRVEATYQQEWEIRSDGSTDWKNFSAWVDTYVCNTTTSDRSYPPVSECMTSRLSDRAT